MNARNNRPYVQNIHRDVRSFMGNEKVMVQMMVLLDDFTHENGATYMLSGSHKIAAKPEEDYFYEHADRAIAKKGSIILFDSNIWHAAGKNNTDGNRRVLTISYTKPQFKQQFDYPRFLGYEFGESLSEGLRQILGYKSRIPATLDEYYQPLNKRMYQPDQG
jgi:ectoine hydroxylase-related dioxygenase (phytanoyl-CoA dioxygenase family)